MCPGVPQLRPRCSPYAPQLRPSRSPGVPQVFLKALFLGVEDLRPDEISWLVMYLHRIEVPVCYDSHVTVEIINCIFRDYFLSGFWAPTLEKCSREGPKHLRCQNKNCIILGYDRSVRSSIFSLIHQELKKLAGKNLSGWGNRWFPHPARSTVYRIFNHLWFSFPGNP